MANGPLSTIKALSLATPARLHVGFGRNRTQRFVAPPLASNRLRSAAYSL